MKKEDEWFAWYPVRLGALGEGKWVWLKTVWFDETWGVRIYQDLDEVRKDEEDIARIEAQGPQLPN